MSILIDIQHRVTEGRLTKLIPIMSNVHVRQIYLSAEVKSFMDGPWPTKKDENKAGRTRAILEDFVTGAEVVGRLPPSKNVHTVIALLEPASEEVWEFRIGEPKPGVRIFGRFADKDIFIGTSWDIESSSIAIEHGGISVSSDVRQTGEIYFLRIHHTAVQVFMTTLAIQDCLLEKKKDEVIPSRFRGYFQQRMYSRIHQLFLSLLRQAEEIDSQFSKRTLAKRIERRPEQLTRWLSYPGNLTLDTISDLALGLGYEVVVSARPILKRQYELNSSIDFMIVDLKFAHMKLSQKIIDEDKRVVFSSHSSGNHAIFNNSLITVSENRPHA